MNREELMATVAAVLTTLDEMKTDVAESMLYLLVGMDMAKWEMLKGALLRLGFVTCSGHRVALTAAGSALAQKCNAVLK